MNLFKFFKHLLVDQFTLGFGGGSTGSGQPTQQNVSQTNIPSYAQPYVENMLGMASALTTQNQYQPYAGQMNAGFTPMQTQAFQNVANQQVAPQLGTATDFATQAGQGMMGSAGIALGYGAKGSAYGDQGAQLGIAGGEKYGALGAQYGGIGSDIGMRALQAQQNYQNMATSPAAMQAYMNPYIQQSLDPQLKLLNQQQALQAQDINAKAAGQGAFGGNRATLAQGLNAQNFDLARQTAIGQGYNTAFTNAQQAQQFGANLGIQGLQTGITGQQAGIQGAQTGLQGVGTQLAGTAQGMQGAQVGLQGVSGAQAGYQGAINASSALGALGQTQYQQQSGINQAMSNAGAQQQALQQQGLTNQYNQYQQSLNYPYQQLGFMSDMVRGLPLTQQSSTIYQAQPSPAQMGLGALGTSAALYGAFKREGGSIKEMAGGGVAKDGVPRFRYGSIINDPKLEAMSNRLSDKQLQTVRGLPGVDQGENQIFNDAAADKQYVRSNPAAAQALMGATAPPPPPPMDPNARESGIALAGGPAFANQGMAGGGIVAFADNPNQPVREGMPPNMSLYDDPMGLYNSPAPTGYGFSVGSLGDVLSAAGTETEWQKADRLKRRGIKYEPPKGYTERGVPIKEEAKPVAVPQPRPAPSQTVAAPPPPPVQEAAPPASGAPVTSGLLAGSNMKDKTAADFLAERQKNLEAAGVTSGPTESQSELMALLKSDRAGKKGEDEQDRYLRIAQAMAEFGSTPGPVFQALNKSAGNFAKNEAIARKESKKADREGLLAAASLEDVIQKRKIGDVDAAEKAQLAYEGHKVTRDNALTTANSHITAAKIASGVAGQSTKLEKDAIDAYMKDNPGSTFSQAYQSVKFGPRQDTQRLTALHYADTALNADTNYLRLSMSKKPEDQLAARTMRENKVKEYLNTAGSQRMGAPGTPGATSTALPMPASAAEAIPGQIYNTTRGPAKWDGKQFVPV